MFGSTLKTNNEKITSIVGMLSHTDLDGYGCEVVLRTAGSLADGHSPAPDIIWHAGYDNLTIETVKDWSSAVLSIVNVDREFKKRVDNIEYMAVITDLLIPEDIAKYIAEFNKNNPGIRIVVIDHHNQKCDIESILPNDTYIMKSWVDANGACVPCCATKLFYDFMYNLNDCNHTLDKLALKSNETLNNFVIRVNSWDTFTSGVLMDVHSRDLNDYLYLVGGYKFVEDALVHTKRDRGLKGIIPLNFQELIRCNQANERKLIEEAFKNGFYATDIFGDEDLYVIVSTKINATAASKYLSEIEYGYKVYPKFALFNPVTRTISFRSVGDNDVSEIATRFGGGGHKNAAGAIIRDPHIATDIMSVYYGSGGAHFMKGKGNR